MVVTRVGRVWWFIRVKQELKMIFLYFLSSWYVWFKSKNNSDILNPQVTWPHESNTSMSNLIDTCRVWVFFVVFYWKKHFCDNHITSGFRVTAFAILFYMGRLSITQPPISKWWPDTQFSLRITFFKYIYFHMIRINSVTATGLKPITT